MNAHSTSDRHAPDSTPAEALMRTWRSLSAASVEFLVELREFDLQRGYALPARTPPHEARDAGGQRGHASAEGDAAGGDATTVDQPAEARQVARGNQAADTAEWLHAVCGMDKAAVREALRVAYKLLNLPRTEAAFAAGELSYRKVRAITTVATAASEEELLPFAVTMTDAQVADYCCRLHRRAQEGGAGGTATGGCAQVGGP